MTDFYVVEATINQGFVDPVGPADSGWLAMPIDALSGIEALAARTQTVYASDQGYRTRDTDPQGVVVYPPTVEEAFSVNVAVNLDPTKSAVAAAWGTMTLSNMDHRYDSLVANWNTDGQLVRVLRGSKALENFPGFATSRATTATYIDQTGTLQVAAPGVVRQDWTTGSPVILNEPAGTNYVRNPLGVGGTVGVIGSGGVVPTFCSMNAVPGLTREFLGNFVVNGIPCQRYRYSGTVTTASAHGIAPERSGIFLNAIPFSQALRYSFWIRLQAGSFTGIPTWAVWLGHARRTRWRGGLRSRSQHSDFDLRDVAEIHRKPDCTGYGQRAVLLPGPRIHRPDHAWWCR
jgi:hypothetical protein